MSTNDAAVVMLAHSGSIKDAMLRYGISRPQVYKLIKAYPQIARRFGGMTLICFAAVEAAIEAMPLSCDAPHRRKNLVNQPGGRVSRKVAAYRARKAAEAKAAAAQ